MNTIDMNIILEPIDKFIKSIDNNKNLLLLILVLLGIYFAFYSNNLPENLIYLFDNEIFKFTLFMIITYISSSSPAIGISLALIMFVSLQIITHIKLKKELENDINQIENDINEEKENFTSIEPVDINMMSNEYLTNPLKKISQLAPPVNINFKYTTPNELSNQMIKQGKNLLNNAYDIEQDNITRYDSREKQIALETKRNGIELVNSGLNRLQKSNNGEYKNNYNSDKFSKYNKFINLHDPEQYNFIIISCYNELLNNYEILINSKLDINDFNKQLNKVYQSEIELLETIYKLNKSSYSDKNQQSINTLINKIKNLSDKEKINITDMLDKLYNMLL